MTFTVKFNFSFPTFCATPSHAADDDSWVSGKNCISKLKRFNEEGEKAFVEICENINKIRSEI